MRQVVLKSCLQHLLNVDFWAGGPICEIDAVLLQKETRVHPPGLATVVTMEPADVNSAVKGDVQQFEMQGHRQATERNSGRLRN
jgi:hypothetical protein